MQREALSSLKDWIRSKNRKPLLIRGARQVGKSTLVRLFAEQQSLDFVEINLERYLILKKAFSSKEVRIILMEIEGIAGRKIDTSKTLLFLDEIQAIPEAIAALRYFYEEYPELAVISAGSLVEFTFSDHSFSMPVGRIEYLHLGPMTFLEFLREIDPYCADFIKSFPFHKKDRGIEPHVSDTLHERLLLRQREYLFIGGMPEAIQVYADQSDFFEVSRIHDSILDTYTDDFSKYSRQADLIRLQAVFRAIPSQIGKKIIYNRFSREDKSIKTKQVLDLLIKARLASRVIHSNANGIPIGAEMNERVFKLLFLDVGLLNRMIGTPVHELHALTEKVLINEGVLAEQFIGQHLLQNRKLRSPLYLNYWQRGEKSNNAEVDYLIQYGSMIVPLEVKAGKKGTLKSLHQFMQEKGLKKAIRMDLNKLSIQKVAVRGADRNTISYLLISLPLYMVDRITDCMED